MRRTKPLTPREQEELDQGWLELGESLVAAVVASGRTVQWAWKLIGPLGLYKRWMIEMWLDRYEQEHPELADKELTNKKRREKITPAQKQSKFTKREQIHEALRLLSQQNGR